VRDPNDSLVLRHLGASYSRAARARDDARRLLDAGYPSAAFVWSVRAAEILLRDFVLTPHFLEQGCDWDEAMDKGSDVLGSSNWDRAFAKAEEWYGPFDRPLTEADRNAWKFWAKKVVPRRGELIHGRPVADASAKEAAEAIDFAERMATWFSQRFMFSSTRHPSGQWLRDALSGGSDDE
jgi:HEPN domain-containing protein